ncbi:RING finger and transmembrane domain-containing protein 1 [Sesamum indicum]|uniref:RING finger and transmembrane domain-containing protein 1 n=1 Tax=Sesamum indicum TaxID=4182 RepID=A0A6I9T177_SESIN|nr:RING finger and transmembrane domain-containing protein 1 [Sesamum indicum]
METSDSAAADLDSGSPSSPSNGGGTIRIVQFPALGFLQSPISSLLEYSGFIRVRPDYPYSETRPLVSESTNASVNVQSSGSNSASVNGNDGVDRSGDSNSGDSSNNGEVSIRIIGEQDRVGGANNGETGGNGVGLGAEGSVVGPDDVNGNRRVNSDNDNNNREALSYQRYDIQQAARWIEQILPFSLLLLVVFIRQHLQGFVVTIYCTAILFKSNDILRKQTALKGERKISVLAGYSVLFMLHIFGIYWWHHRDDLIYPLLMIPPKAIPPFWHAVFIILVNDTMARQTAMVLKLVLLMYYKNGRGHNFRRQGQMLTLVEYTLLLYRALLPTPVWYRFFLNKDYGSLFSSLTTGLYLTFKLTSIVEKVQSFFAALKALSRKEVHYGSYATPEQVNAAGDLCAICQEKMHVPVLLRCKHIFCEDCVSEWFERERTCPLCRALVRPADLQSYGDGSTSLFFQLF